MSRIKGILAGLLVAAAGAWFIGNSSSNMSATTSELANSLVGAASAQSTEIDTSTIEEMVMGDPDAPVTVIEYASYTCPHCANFHANQLKQLKSEYIDTGKVKFIYREVYFDRYGLWASAIARCAGPEKFFGITDLMFKGQSEWARAGDPAAIAEELRKIGRLAGIGNEQIEACLTDGDKMRTLVAWFEENAGRDKIESTPSLMINGRLYKNMAYDDLKEILDEALGS